MMAITTRVELGHATAMTPARSEATPYATIHPQALPSRASIAVISPPRVVSMSFLLVAPDGRHRGPLFRPGDGFASVKRLVSRGQVGEPSLCEIPERRYPEATTGCRSYVAFEGGDQ